VKFVIGDGVESFELHVAPLQLPLVVLLEEKRTDEPDNRWIVGKDADDVGAPLDLRIEPL
jgi:hypothetical protein